MASASGGIPFFEKIFFTVSGVGQKLKSDNFLLKVPDPLLHPAWVVAAFGPDPIAAEKKPPEELAADWSPAAAAEAVMAAAAAVPVVPAGVSATGAVWSAAAASGVPA